MHKDKVQRFEAAVDNSRFVMISLIKFLPNSFFEVFVSCETVADLIDVFDDYEQEAIVKEIKSLKS